MKVELTHSYGTHAIGDLIEVSDQEAEQLIRDRGARVPGQVGRRRKAISGKSAGRETRSDAGDDEGEMEPEPETPGDGASSENSAAGTESRRRRGRS